MKISIVIPVFNAEKYLERCLRSVVRALDNFNGTGEIILVDNNSNDSSHKIMASFQQKYPHLVFLVNQHTPGASAARNYGMSKARGDYVWFVDADDEIAENSISKMMRATNGGSADLIMLSARRIYPDGHSDVLSAICPSEKNYKSRFVRYGAGPWQFIIRKKWWQNNNFKFREGIIHEDMELISALILYTDKFFCVKDQLYYYYQNPGSVLHQDKWNPHSLDIFPALTGLYARFKNAGAEEEFHDELEWFFIWNLLIDSAKDFAPFREGKEGFRKTKIMLKEYFPSWRKNRFLQQKPLKMRMRVLWNYYRY